MTEDQLNIWLKALESGRYEQGRERLRRTNRDAEDLPVGFCCLGVYCDVVLEPEGVGSWQRLGTVIDVEFLYEPNLIAYEIYLPVEEIPLYVQVVLVGYNDGDDARAIKPHTFTQLAGVIRKIAKIDPVTKLVEWPPTEEAIYARLGH